MKKDMIMKLSIIVLVCAALVATACRGPNDPVSPPLLDGKGSVSINFGGGNERTLLPSEINITKLHYVLNFTKTDGSGNITETQNGSGQLTLQLNIGTWNLVIRGYNSANDATDTAKALVFYTQNSIVISYGESVTINAKLLPNLNNLTQNGMGTLRYNITLPEGAAGVLKVYNHPAKTLVGSPVILSATESHGSLELTSGNYDISINIEYQDKVKIWSEIAHIYDNAITEAVVGPNDFTDYLPPPGPVDIYLSMDKFFMTDEGAGIFVDIQPIILFSIEESSRTIAVDGLVVINWQVGDTVLGTGNNITLNASLFPAGVYTLRLAFIKNGKPWQSNLAFEVVGTTLHVTNTAQWENALTTIQSNGSNKGHIIAVNGNIAVPGIGSNFTSFGSNNTNVTVFLRGSGKLYLNSQGSIIRLGNGHTLIIDSEDLILEGLTNGQNGFTQDNIAPVVFVQNNGNLELKQGTISGNTNPQTNYGYGGGGVYVNSNGTFTMGGGNITNNSTGGWRWGSGVYIWQDGIFIMTGGAISSNDGQGVMAYGNFTMSGNATVSGHYGSSGVSVSTGTFIMKDNASVYGNTEDGNGGGGVNVSSGTLIMQDNAKIFGNSATSNVSPTGGGIQIWGNSIVTMQGNASIYDNNASFSGGGIGIRGNGILIMQDNSSIYDNTANTGGGVSVGRGNDDSGTLIMQNNASIHTNNSSSFGGGIRIHGTGTLTMLDYTSVYENISADWGGGGVAISHSGIFTMKGSSSVYGNTSNYSSYGGGVSAASGTFIMQENASVHGNIAREGGGVSVGWGSQTQGIFIMQDNSSVYGNTTSGSISNNTGFGGGVNVAAGGSLRISGGSIYGNSSGEMSNTATNNGAALYLSPYSDDPSQSSTGQFGIFNGEIWSSTGDLDTTNDTILVVNGHLQ